MKLLIPLLILATLLTPMTGLASPRGQIVAIDNSVFVAMVDPSIEDCISTQERDNWCWASCIQMILRYNGIRRQQSEIVAHVYGASYDWTASGNEIAGAFDGWNGFTVRSFQSKRAQSFINETAAGHPLIVGFAEHAYLLTHIYYKKTSNGLLRPFKVIMVNPSTGNEEVLDWNKFFASLNTIVSFYK